LALLTDGPSSFVALYGFCVTHNSYPGTIPDFMSLLERLEAAGLIRMLQRVGGKWHQPSPEQRRTALHQYQTMIPKLEGDFSVDEIGFWYELTPVGDTLLVHPHSGRQGRDDLVWSVDEDGVSKTVVAKGETLDEALYGLEQWRRVRPELEAIEDTKTVERIDHFSLRDGTRISDGVKVTFRFRNK